MERIIESLDLVPGDKVLDAPCGHGRIANQLAERGFEVTGVDATLEFIDIARKTASERKLEVDYRVGDLRSLGIDGPFDALVCWFTSFGYSDDSGKSQHQVRLPTIPEFGQWLAAAGFVDVEYFGADRSPPAIDDMRLVVVATR